MADPDYQDEFDAALATGFTAHLFDFDELTREKNAGEAIRRIKANDALKKILYRGWMLKPRHYAMLYQALLLKNFALINTPAEYQNCHYLPDSYPFIKEHTPETIWLRLDNQHVSYDEVYNRLEPFGNSPLIVKDFVKSQKHHWDSACFVPSAADKEKLKSVINRFLSLQNSDLNEGLVTRKFIALEDLAIHSKSGMPLKEEYRLFFLNKELIGCYDYWEEGEYSTSSPPLRLFKDVANTVESNFFSMDIAKTKSGGWIIIELGDGQVAGLPDKANRLVFYDALGKILNA